MRGLILLDGADAVGKTTLATTLRDLAVKQGAVAEIHHLGKPEQGRCWDEHKAAICRYLVEAFRGGKLIIADRHFLSEGIYGEVYRTGSEYPFAARHFDRLLHRFRALRVICAPPVPTVVESHSKMKEVRREEYDSGMDRVAQRYLDLWHGATQGGTDTGVWQYEHSKDYLQQLTVHGGTADRLGWYHYDFTQQGKDKELYARFLLHELATEQELLPEELLDIDEWRFTGFPSPSSVLLVGDQIKSDNELHCPFLSNSNSSLFLANKLHECHVDESRVVIANVNDPGGTRAVRELAAMCGRTVAMGREAEKTLLGLGVRYDARVRHPQHARRFSYRDDSYAQELKLAFNGWAKLEVL